MKKIFWVIAVVAVMVAIGCKKDNNDNQEPTPVGEGIYTAGSISFAGENPYAGGLHVACWKNGKMMPGFPLDDSSGAAEMVVSGGKIYIAGYKMVGGVKHARCWVDGKAVAAYDVPNAEYNSLFISGNDVYMAGIRYVSKTEYCATVWKNGKRMESLNASEYSLGYSVFVSGADVYVAGVEFSKARCWKNGVNILNNTVSWSLANDVYVDNGNVYVVGKEYVEVVKESVIRCWKNGDPQPMEHDNLYGSGQQVLVHNGDIYVTGYYEIANGYPSGYWKNGTFNRITGDYAMVEHIFIAASGIYLTVVEGDEDNPYPVYWKGDQKHYPEMPAGTFFVGYHSISVVPGN